MTLRHRRAEGLKQRAVDRIALRVVLGVPLHAQRKTRRIGDADEGWCNLVVGPWTEYPLIVWYLSSFNVPTLRAFLGALWAGIETCDVLVLEQR